MRAVECAMPGCQHLHAEDDGALARLLLRHTHHAHPGVRMEESDADALVDEAGYYDKKHRKRKGLSDVLGDPRGVFGGG